MSRWSIAFVCLVIGALAGSFLLPPLFSGERAAKNTVVNNDLSGKTVTPPAITHIPRELTSYRDVVKQVLPAVVSIETQPKARPKTKKAPRQRQGFGLPQVPDEQRKYFQGMEDDSEFQTPEETPSRSFGSGFLVDPKGVILTNYHVVAGADQVEVTLRDGSKFMSADIKGDRKTDLAIVRIDAKGKALPYLELGDSEGMQIGDRVLAVGAPFGLTGSVTAGIVSAKGRNGLHMNMYEDFIQTDAAINPGNSGGPLVNLEGKVIGINAAIKTRSGGFQGVGLAVASNLAKNVMNNLLKYGTVHRGYLGVQIKDLTPEVARRLGLDHAAGVVVAQVFPSSPAAKAGIQPGDVITAMNGQPVKDGRVLQTLVAGLAVHKSVPVAIVRDGKLQTLSVLIQEQPAQLGGEENPTQEETPQAEEPQSLTLEKYGIEVGDLTPQTAKALGFPKGTKGPVLMDVDPDSPAYAAGLRKGTLVTKVNRKAVPTAAALKDALAKADSSRGVLLQVRTAQGGTDYVVLKPAKAVGRKQ